MSNTSTVAKQFEWTRFMRGFVFWETPQPAFGPPDPNDIEGLREWLAGFCQAHADAPDRIPTPPDYEEVGETVAEALDRLLVGHPALLTLKTILWPA